MAPHWIVIVAALVNIFATALIVLGTAARLGRQLGALETKVEAVWLWFCQRSQSPGIRRSDHE